MPSTKNILAIAGAAEGSYYTALGATKDERYKPSFASATSGLSFGIFQFDAATNTEAKSGLREMLAKSSLDKATGDKLYQKATTRNAGALLTKAEKDSLAAVLSTVVSQRLIDALDEKRALSCGVTIDTIIAQGAAYWLKKLGATPSILTPFGTGNLRLFAYLLACWNKFPENRGTFEQWLRGEKVKTLNGPADGFQLTDAPTLEQMHAFLGSLRIWSGTNGKYQYLRDRLDPTLDRLGA